MSKNCFDKCGKSEKDNPKKPNYYCGKFGKFVNIPGDFKDIASAQKACECDYSKGVQAAEHSREAVIARQDSEQLVNFMIRREQIVLFFLFNVTLTAGCWNSDRGVNRGSSTHDLAGQWRSESFATQTGLGYVEYCFRNSGRFTSIFRTQGYTFDDHGHFALEGSRIILTGTTGVVASSIERPSSEILVIVERDGMRRRYKRTRPLC